MRTFAYLILAYIALGLQVGLTPFIRIGNGPPNLVLLAALFIALNAPKDAALLGCFALGLMQDLLTQQTLGLFALSYGLVAMTVLSAQQFLYRDHPLTHISVAFLGAMICAIVILLHGMIHPADRVELSRLFYSGIYTTILSPIILGILQSIRKMFGFHPRRARSI
jgi:rod shape-determining protein MreD